MPNPCFLLSGLCMLVGCYLVNAAAHLRKDELLPVVGMVVTVMVYQALVAALAVWLVRRPDGNEHRRDAVMLSGLLLLLASDVTLLLQELVVASPWAGALLGTSACMASVMELLWVLGALGVRLGPVGWAVTAANLALSFALAGLFRGFGHNGFLPTAAVYAGCWVVAGSVGWTSALWVAHAWHEPWRATKLHAFVLAVPVGAQLLHLWAGTFAFGIDMSATLIAPLLVGLAAALMLLCPAWIGRPAGVLAMLLALAMTGDVPWMPDHTGLTPWRLTLLGCAAVLLASGLLVRSWMWAATSALPAALVFVGAGADDTGKTLGQAGQRSAGWLGEAWAVVRGLVPDTMMEWGVTAVALAFLLLGAGTAWVTRRNKYDPPTRPANVTTPS